MVMKRLLTIVFFGVLIFNAKAQRIEGMYFNLGNSYMLNSNQPDFYKNSIGNTFNFGVFNQFAIKKLKSRLNSDFTFHNFHYEDNANSAVANQIKFGIDFLVNPFTARNESQLTAFFGVGVYTVFQTRSFEPQSGLDTKNDGIAGYVGIAFKLNYYLKVHETDKFESGLTLGFAYYPKILFISRDDIPEFTTTSITLGYQFGRKIL